MEKIKKKEKVKLTKYNSKETLEKLRQKYKKESNNEIIFVLPNGKEV